MENCQKTQSYRIFWLCKRLCEFVVPKVGPFIQYTSAYTDHQVHFSLASPCIPVHPMHTGMLAFCSTYLHTCVHRLLHINIRAYLHTWSALHTCILGLLCILAYLPTCILADLHTCLFAYLHTFRLGYLHTGIHSYSHTCILAYLHTYILAYLHNHMIVYSHTCTLAYLHTCILA